MSQDTLTIEQRQIMLQQLANTGNPEFGAVPVTGQSNKQGQAAYNKIEQYDAQKIQQNGGTFKAVDEALTDRFVDSYNQQHGKDAGFQPLNKGMSFDDPKLQAAVRESKKENSESLAAAAAANHILVEDKANGRIYDDQSKEIPTMSAADRKTLIQEGQLAVNEKLRAQGVSDDKLLRTDGEIDAQTRQVFTAANKGAFDHLDTQNARENVAAAARGEPQLVIDADLRKVAMGKVEEIKKLQGEIAGHSPADVLAKVEELAKAQGIKNDDLNQVIAQVENLGQNAAGTVVAAAGSAKNKVAMKAATTTVAVVDKHVDGLKALQEALKINDDKLFGNETLAAAKAAGLDVSAIGNLGAHQVATKEKVEQFLKDNETKVAALEKEPALPGQHQGATPGIIATEASIPKDLSKLTATAEVQLIVNDFKKLGGLVSSGQANEDIIKQIGAEAGVIQEANNAGKGQGQMPAKAELDAVIKGIEKLAQQAHDVASMPIPQGTPGIAPANQGRNI